MFNIEPLKHLRVLDFSWVWSGPLVAATLGEFGAQVIKVEHGKRLDNSRLRGRPLSKGIALEGPSIEIGPYFHQTNHDKLSITLDLKMKEAQDLLHQLIPSCDVIIENLSPGALDRVGMGYEEVSKINPRLIYLSMSAVGQTGPMNTMRAYAPIMSSYCGFESLIGYPDEQSIGMMNFGYGDPNAAIHALLPLLACIKEVQETKKGQHIDMSQIEGLMTVTAEPLIDFMMNGRQASPVGNRHKKMAPHGIYPSLGVDQWVSIAVANDTQWLSLIDKMGRPKWACQSEWIHSDARAKQSQELDDGIGKWTQQFEAQVLVKDLRGVGIACSPVQDIEAQWVDPHFENRGLRQKVNHPISGPEFLYRTPWKMDNYAGHIKSSAPILGQDNEYVFKTILGLTQQRYEELISSGVIS
jgi:crotonobetainyl-CoA:carnitine CoA-transferase CaiB-like acyl-CoA transferase